MKNLWIVFSLTLFFSCSKDNSYGENKPEFHKSDIDLFWELFDSGNYSEQNVLAEYLNKGSIGLRDYGSQKNLDRALPYILSDPAHIRYYNSIRENTKDLSSAIGISKDAFTKLKNIYPGTEAFDVYFIIGALSAGGRISDNGLMIAVEMFAKSDDTTLFGLSDWQKTVVRNKEFLPSIVVHEFVHLQQQAIRKNTNSGSLLEQSILEGMSDFISHTLLPEQPFMNAHLHRYADPIEEQIWNEFESDLNFLHSSTEWLYTGARTANGHPADMGYYVGYKILEAYSENFENKDEAIASMLAATDYINILKESGYAKKFK